MRRVPQTLARVEAQGEAKPLVAHPVRAASISDDGSDSSVRYGSPWRAEQVLDTVGNVTISQLGRSLVAPEGLC